MSAIYSIAVFLVCFMAHQMVEAQVMIPGGCPNKTVVTDFQLDRYLGKWYEAKKYFAIFEAGGKCISATYTDKGNGVVEVHNQQINALGTKSEILGEARLAGSPNEGKLSVIFPSMPIKIAAPYWILAVDYDNYALVWSCMDLGLMHSEITWVLTRDRHPSQSVTDAVNAAIEENKIDQSHFITTDQSKCTKKKD